MIEPLPGARNVKLVLSYDGTDFHGWQRQPGLPTIQGSLENVIEQVTGDSFGSERQRQDRRGGPRDRPGGEFPDVDTAGTVGLGQGVQCALAEDDPGPVGRGRPLRRSTRPWTRRRSATDTSSTTVRWPTRSPSVTDGTSADGSMSTGCKSRRGPWSAVTIIGASRRTGRTGRPASGRSSRSTSPARGRPWRSRPRPTASSTTWSGRSRGHWCWSAPASGPSPSPETPWPRRSRTAAGPTAPPWGLFLLWVRYGNHPQTSTD